jgi:hypothetical protein
VRGKEKSPRDPRALGRIDLSLAGAPWQVHTGCTALLSFQVCTRVGSEDAAHADT